MSGLGWPQCVCTVGAQPCPVHPGNTRTKEEKIAFRVAWDARVKTGVEMGKPTRLGELLKGVEDEIRSNAENAGVSNETAATGSGD